MVGQGATAAPPVVASVEEEPPLPPAPSLVEEEPPLPPAPSSVEEEPPLPPAPSPAEGEPPLPSLVEEEPLPPEPSLAEDAPPNDAPSLEAAPVVVAAPVEAALLVDSVSPLELMPLVDPLLCALSVSSEGAVLPVAATPPTVVVLVDETGVADEPLISDGPVLPVGVTEAWEPLSSAPAQALPRMRPNAETRKLWWDNGR